MRIAYLSADFGVPLFGHKGASIHVREMVTALQLAGHDVCVVSPATVIPPDQVGTAAGSAPASPFPPPAQTHAGLTFLEASPPPHHFHLLKELEALDAFMEMRSRVRQEMRNLIYNLTLYRTAYEYLRNCRIDFIYERYALFGHAGVRLARTLGVPHILEVNAPLAYEQEKMRGLEMKELARASERQIFRHTDRVIVVSQSLQEFVVACGVPPERVRLVPNAVDPQRFVAPAGGREVRARHGLMSKRVIGFVGSLKPWHGTETLLAAFQRLHAQAPDTHLLIVGDGPGREALEQQVSAHGLQGAVTFTGNVAYARVPEYLAAMEIAVAPYTPHENFYYSPIKIFEYMVMGTAVVAGAIGQVKDLIIPGETGVLYEPGEVARLHEALARLVADPELVARLGANAKAWVTRERTWDNNARQVLALVQEVREQQALEPTEA